MLNLRRKSARFSEMGLIYVETTSVWTNHNTFTLFNSIDSIMVSGEELFAIQKEHRSSLKMDPTPSFGVSMIPEVPSNPQLTLTTGKF